LLDLKPEKYDICISIVVVNGGDTGKKSHVFKRSIFVLYSQYIKSLKTERQITIYGQITKKEGDNYGQTK